jgi:hypothetical protein
MVPEKKKVTGPLKFDIDHTSCHVSGPLKRLCGQQESSRPEVPGQCFLFPSFVLVQMFHVLWVVSRNRPNNG